MDTAAEVDKAEEILLECLEINGIKKIIAAPACARIMIRILIHQYKRERVVEILDGMKKVTLESFDEGLHGNKN